MRLELPDGDTAVVSDHALERWQERCPTAAALEPAAALELLQRVVDRAGELTFEPPAWWWTTGNGSLPRVWLVIGDYAMPLLYKFDSDELVIPTVIVRGVLPELEREERRAERRARAGRRRKNKRDMAKSGARSRRRELRHLDVDRDA